MKWEKSIIALVSILENPLVESGYKQLKNFYDANNLEHESNCIDYLIKIKFKNDKNSNISEKQ